jgi:endonuclease/exonuclease/phosphatase family metal-dependent hydrolase
MYQAAELHEAEVDPRVLRVLTWNIKFGGGRLDFFWDCYGDRALMTQAEVIGHLEGLARKIQEIDPDLILLQEVDVESKRSAYVDQVQWLLDHTDLNYGAYASQWKADVIPSDGMGRMEMGNATLSRWPIVEAWRKQLAPVGEYDTLKRYFYLKRGLLDTRIAIPSREDFWVVNAHTEAYSSDGTKQLQLNAFHDDLVAHRDGGWLVIGGGDLNAIPPDSEQQKGFVDSKCTGEYVDNDYSAENDWLDELYADFRPAVTLEAYAQDNARYFTHTTDKDGFWNRKLDYFFTSATWVQGSALTYQDETTGIATMPLSDHCPFGAVLEWP